MDNLKKIKTTNCKLQVAAAVSVNNGRQHIVSVKTEQHYR